MKTRKKSIKKSNWLANWLVSVFYLCYIRILCLLLFFTFRRMEVTRLIIFIVFPVLCLTIMHPRFMAQLAGGCKIQRGKHPHIDCTSAEGYTLPQRVYSGQLSWRCRIHRPHLCRGVNTPTTSVQWPTRLGM